MSEEIDLLDENPWKDFDYNGEGKDNCLAKDESAIDTNNDRFQKSHTERNNKVYKQLCPLPFVGDIEHADVYILQANPGLMLPPLSDDPVPVEKRSKPFTDRIEACLHQEFEDMSYPFYFLDPEIWHINGSIWWRTNLEPLLQQLAEEEGEVDTNGVLKEDGNAETYYRHLANKLCAVEIHGYRSNNFRKPKPPIPSSDFSCSIVEHAMEKDSVVLLTRSKNWWYEHVDELKDYDQLIETNSPQNVTISENNISNNGFRKVLLPALKL